MKRRSPAPSASLISQKSFRKLNGEFWLLIAILIAFSCMTCSCKQKKSVSELSKEEKLLIDLDDSLSPQEKSDQVRARKEILDRIDNTNQADDALNEAISDARNVLSDQDFKILESNQSQWLRQGKGSDINALINEGLSPADAFAKATERRADWIRIHVSWAMLLDMPGKWGGLYHSTDNRLLEIYEMPDNAINVVVRVPKSSGFTYTGTGTSSDDSARIHPEGNPTVMLEILRHEEGKVELQCTPEFDESSFAKLKTLIEGQFIRYGEGEFSPFETGMFDAVHSI